MTAVAEVGPPVSPLLVAGLLLAAAEHLRVRDLPCPTVAQVIASTGASRSRAYELRDAVLAALPSLQQPVGRPPSPPREASPDTARAVLSAVTTFLMDHPGCVYGGSERRRYTDAFRHFVIELRERHADVELDHFADAVMPPLGTLKDWLGAGVGDDAAEDAPEEADNVADATSTVQARRARSRGPASCPRAPRSRRPCDQGAGRVRATARTRRGQAGRPRALGGRRW